MDFVYEQDGLVVVFQSFHHTLKTLFKVAAEPGSSEQSAHVESVDVGILEALMHVAHLDFARQSFDQGRLAHAAIANEQRVVLTTTSEHLNGPLNLVGTPDERVDLTLLSPFVQVRGVGSQGIVSHRRFAIGTSPNRHALRPGRLAVLADAMADERGDIETGHALRFE